MGRNSQTEFAEQFAIQGGLITAAPSFTEPFVGGGKYVQQEKAVEFWPGTYCRHVLIDRRGDIENRRKATGLSLPDHPDNYRALG